MPGIFEICRNSNCNANEGPTFELEVNCAPPSFKLRTETTYRIGGVAGPGALIEIAYQGLHFDATFAGSPMNLFDGNLQILQSDFQQEGGGCTTAGNLMLLDASHSTRSKARSRGLSTGGPNVVFSSSSGGLTISGKLKFFGTSVDGCVEISTSQILAVMQVQFIGFTFTATLQGSFSAGLTVSLEAEGGSSGSASDVREKLRSDTMDKLTALKQAGQQAINDAKAPVEEAQQALNDAQNSLQQEQNNVNSICEEEINDDLAL